MITTRQIAFQAKTIFQKGWRASVIMSQRIRVPKCNGAHGWRNLRGCDDSGKRALATHHEARRASTSEQARRAALRPPTFAARRCHGFEPKAPVMEPKRNTLCLQKRAAINHLTCAAANLEGGDHQVGASTILEQSPR